MIFEVKTGGITEVFQGTCRLHDIDIGDSSNVRKVEQIVAAVEGIGNVACGTSHIIKSDVLESICDISELAEEYSLAGQNQRAIGLIIDDPRCTSLCEHVF